MEQPSEIGYLVIGETFFYSLARVSYKMALTECKRRFSAILIHV